MTAAGIIAEYNPFHNGHAWQIRQARKNADYVVVVMSPDFVQRGEPALIDKYTRTRMALEGGADLVLEMPVAFATGSAEYFAWGGVQMLNRLGCVSSLVFGCEDASLPALLCLARLLSREPEDYRTNLQNHMRQGLSFPAARERAVADILGQQSADLLKSPNNILAVEYLKALLATDGHMQPVPLPRQGGISSSHHSHALPRREEPEAFTSAGAIRAHLLSGGNPETLDPYLPAQSARLLKESLACRGLVETGRLDAMLYYALCSRIKEHPYAKDSRLPGTDDGPRPDERSDRHSLTGFLDVSPSLADRIVKNMPFYMGFETFSALLCSRSVPEARVRRALIHVLLDIRKDPVELRRSCVDFGYARILGFRRQAQPLLHAIKESSSIPLIARPSKAASTLNRISLPSFQEDIFASQLYARLRAPETAARAENPGEPTDPGSQAKPGKRAFGYSEYTHSPVIME